MGFSHIESLIFESFSVEVLFFKNSSSKTHIHNTILDVVGTLIFLNPATGLGTAPMLESLTSSEDLQFILML